MRLHTFAELFRAAQVRWFEHSEIRGAIARGLGVEVEHLDRLRLGLDVDGSLLVPLHDPESAAFVVARIMLGISLRTDWRTT